MAPPETRVTLLRACLEVHSHPSKEMGSLNVIPGAHLASFPAGLAAREAKSEVRKLLAFSRTCEESHLFS
jgi:hypothetical protein